MVDLSHDFNRRSVLKLRSLTALVAGKTKISVATFKTSEKTFNTVQSFKVSNN